MSAWRFRKLLLDIYYLASEMEGTFMIPTLFTLSPLSRMTHPLIMTRPHLPKIFVVKTFASCHKTVKFAIVFTDERFPLYDSEL